MSDKKLTSVPPEKTPAQSFSLSFFLTRSLLILPVTLFLAGAGCRERLVNNRSKFRHEIRWELAAGDKQKFLLNRDYQSHARGERKIISALSADGESVSTLVLGKILGGKKGDSYEETVFNKIYIHQVILNTPRARYVWNNPASERVESASLKVIGNQVFLRASFPLTKIPRVSSPGDSDSGNSTRNSSPPTGTPEKVDGKMLVTAPIIKRGFPL